MDIARLGYKPGWRFRRGGPGDRFLCVYAQTPNSWPPHAPRLTQHQFDPDAESPFARLRQVVDALERCDNDAAPLLASLLLVEFHEAAEFLQVDGERPFYPNHQDEGSPYELVDRRTT